MSHRPEAEEIFSDNVPGDAEDGVTVAISLYNYEEYIVPCLVSILQQTHEAIDLIVVDDASRRDKSVQIAADWMRDHRGRFRRSLLLRHSRNQGLAEARNTAFFHSRTDHVFVMDADNIAFPTAISQLSAALRGSSAAAAYSQLALFGDEECVGIADFWSKAKLAKGNYIDAMAVVSKSAWRDVGGYSHIEGGWEDYDFWCKFVDHGLEAIFVPQILCGYRVHGSSMLRNDTIVALEEVKNRLLLRHPWLEF